MPIYVGILQSTVLEFLNNLWGLGTEKEKGCLPARLATYTGVIHSLESIPGLLKNLKYGLSTCYRYLQDLADSIVFICYMVDFRPEFGLNQRLTVCRKPIYVN